MRLILLSHFQICEKPWFLLSKTSVEGTNRNRTPSSNMTDWILEAELFTDISFHNKIIKKKSLCIVPINPQASLGEQAVHRQMPWDSLLLRV